MPRPCKRRRICALPGCRGLLPSFGNGLCNGDNDEEYQDILLPLDEYECIRLIDYNHLTQEECALRMGVARTTVQAIYTAARTKLAACLVEGRPLRIQGGDYVLCQGENRCCPKAERMDIMKIAVTYDNGEIFQHFGHTEAFKVYEVEGDKVVSSQVVDTNGSGHGALAGFLKEQGVDTLICGGIGGGAQNALAEAGIRLFGGCSGSADEAVTALVEGRLAFNPDVHCDHHSHEHGHEHGHGHGHGHSCGNHGCGEHSCH